ncbi:MAG: Ig-like domain-containing protein [Clostridiaceae bacterium]|nr:Ig-like domain-containing protein [Clostridiaceae bacterium]
MICSNCGGEVKEGTKFCIKCGTPQDLAKIQKIDSQASKKRRSFTSRVWVRSIIGIVILIGVLVGIGFSEYTKSEETNEKKALRDQYLKLGRYQNAIDINPKNVDTYLEILKLYSVKNMEDEGLLILKEGYRNTSDGRLKDKIQELKDKLPVTDIGVTINQNEKYDLPARAKIKVNNSEEDLVVKWDQATADTSKVGTYTLLGVSEKYERKVKLTLKIIYDILQIEDLNAVITQGQQYVLPQKVTAKMKDNTTREFDVLWNSSVVNTDKVSSQVFNGSIDGYDKNVKLTLNISPIEKQVQMGKTLKDKLDTFFSSFAEADVKPFQNSDISDEELMNFTILNIYKNNWDLKGYNKLVETRSGDINNGFVKAATIDTITYKYFGKKVTVHKSIPGYTYEKGYYKLPRASVIIYPFSQVNKLYDLGNNLYIAEISIYQPSINFVGDPHGSLDNWLKSDPHSPPTLSKKVTTRIKKVNEAGKERYILISYQ